MELDGEAVRQVVPESGRLGFAQAGSGAPMARRKSDFSEPRSREGLSGQALELVRLDDGQACPFDRDPLIASELIEQARDGFA